MTREWKPGDVGVSTSNERFIVTSMGDCFWPGETARGWSAVSGRPTDCDRPLVVIDPEDAEQVKRLDDLLERFTTGNEIPQYEGTVGSTRAALREFANPTPPKPDEPTGLGAVVVDDEGRRWVRLGEIGADDWRRSGLAGGQRGKWTRYDQIAAVRVLSEGVQP